MNALPLAKAFMLIEPGPVTLVTTAVGRRKNIMTISWAMVMDFTPKLAFVTGPWNHSYQALVETGECVIAECIANIECRVIDHVKRHDLFVLEGVRAWSAPDASKRRMFHAVGDGTFVADGRRFTHRALMSGKLPPGV